MVTNYEISFIKIKIHYPSEIDLTRFEIFQCEPYFNNYINITIEKKDKINVCCNVVFRHASFSAVDFGDGKYGYLFYSAEGTPCAFVKSDIDWKDIDIHYTENFQTANRSMIDCALGAAFNNIIIANGGLVVHSSAIHYQNKGIIFSAPSGTGKSTHAKYWREYLGAGIINDDSPALMIKNNDVLVCGTPWSGSTDLYSSICVPLHVIIVLSQHHCNEIYRMNNKEIIHALFPRCLFPYHSPQLINMAFENFTKMIGSVPVYHLKCTPSLEAAKLVKSYLQL